MESISRHRFKDLNTLTLTLQLGGYISEMLYWGYIEPEYWRNYRHIHSFFEVCYAFEGSGYFRIGSKTVDIHHGDLFIARPNEPHEIISSHDRPLGICFWAYTLVPSGTNVLEWNKDKHDPLRALIADFVESSLHKTTASTTLTDTINLLTKEITNRQAGFALSVQGLATNLLVETGRLGCEQTVLSEPSGMSRISPKDTVLVAQIKRYLQDNYMHAVQLKEVAAQAHLSERHISRLFSQSTGSSIQQYLSTIRVDVAKQLLLDLTISVSEVARATGFNDPRYFSTFFRRNTGETPTAFRHKRGTEFLNAAD